MVTSHFLHTSLLCYRHLFLEPKDQEASLRLSLLSFDSTLPCLSRAALLRLCIETLSRTMHCACSIQSLNQCLKSLQEEPLSLGSVLANIGLELPFHLGVLVAGHRL